MFAVPGQNSIAVKRYYGTPGRYPGILTYYWLGSKIIRNKVKYPQNVTFAYFSRFTGGDRSKGG